MEIDSTEPESPVRTTSTEPHGAPRKAARPTGTQNTTSTNRRLTFIHEDSGSGSESMMDVDPNIDPKNRPTNTPNP